MRLGLLPTLVALSACNALSVEPKAHLAPMCTADASVGAYADLVQLDVPAAEVGKGAPVVVTRDGLWLDGEPIQDVASLGTRAKEVRERIAEVRRFSGSSELDTGLAELEIAGDVPNARVVDVLAALQRAGFSAPALVVLSNEPRATPPYPDPAYAEALKERIAAASPDMRQMVVAKEIDELIGSCAGAREVFDAVATASPEMRCDLLAHGMGEALPGCWFVNGDRIVTALHVMAEPRTASRASLIRLTLADDAPMIRLQGSTWADAAGALAQGGGAAVSAIDKPVEEDGEAGEAGAP